MSTLKDKTYRYQAGFGNHFVSEVLPGAIPSDQNSPQQCPYGLYAEQLSGTSFTTPRAKNQSSWLYRVLPASIHEPFTRCKESLIGPLYSSFGSLENNPNQLRWHPPSVPGASHKVDWVQGLVTVAGTGDASLKTGIAIHVYTANADMKDKAFCNSDGDLLIVPQQGRLDILTEFGWMMVKPGEICVIQRGIRFSVFLPDVSSRGYVCEVFGGHFSLPELGPIGASGLANPRDFLTPTAFYEDRQCDFLLVNKFLGELFHAKMDFSPYNVVGWHGNYAPYKYDLSLFNAMNTVTFDHPDPSIFTVLTCATNEPGVAACDFVIFPPRWAVAEHTFRPPYFHRNTMSEYMGLIYGSYEAKEKGFLPGGGSLHSTMIAHGPEAEVFEKASTCELKPTRLAENSLAFMFETTYMLKLTPWALKPENIDADYFKCWQGLRKHFNPNKI